MIYQQTIQLIGKPLNHPDIQAYLVEHGFKQSKKSEISGRSSEYSFWVEHKKLGVNLLFSIEVKNPIYVPMAGSKKGMWVPVLQYVTFFSPKIEYPLGLKMGLSLAETEKLLGAPSYKSSDIHKVWLNNDGSESFYGWKKRLDEEKQLELDVRIKVDKALDEINVSMIELREVDRLYNVFNNENVAILKKQPNLPTAMLMEWAIKNGHFVGEPEQAELIAKVKAGSANGNDFLQAQTNHSTIYCEQFIPSAQDFIWRYSKNMSGYDILYSRDYSLCFLTDNAQRNNYLGEDALATLQKVEYSDDNKAKIFAILDIRLEEFNAHSFAKSKPILE